MSNLPYLISYFMSILIKRFKADPGSERNTGDPTRLSAGDVCVSSLGTLLVLHIRFHLIMLT